MTLCIRYRIEFQAEQLHQTNSIGAVDMSVDIIHVEPENVQVLASLSSKLCTSVWTAELVAVQSVHVWHS
jgi:hypothetical protein